MDSIKMKKVLSQYGNVQATFHGLYRAEINKLTFHSGYSWYFAVAAKKHQALKDLYENIRDVVWDRCLEEEHEKARSKNNMS